MDSVIAVNKLMEPAFTFDPLTATTNYFVKFVLHIQSGTIEKVNYTTVEALCSYITVQAVQEGSKCTQYNSK